MDMHGSSTIVKFQREEKKKGTERIEQRQTSTRREGLAKKRDLSYELVSPSKKQSNELSF
jgi:hypothetical protein